MAEPLRDALPDTDALGARDASTERDNGESRETRPRLVRVPTRPMQTRPLPVSGNLDSLDRLSRLYDIVRSLNSIIEIEKLLNQILASAAQMVEARGGFVMLADAEGRTLRYEVTSGRASSGLKGQVLPVDMRSVPGMVAMRGVACTLNDVSRTTYYASQKSTNGYTIKKLLCVPLKVQGRVTGVVQVMDKVSGEDFNRDDQKLLEAMSDAAAVAIENVRLLEAERKKTELLKQALDELHRTYRATVQALTGLLDARDEATHGHSNRVTVLALRLARALGINDPVRLRTIEQGARLHDIGKIGVRDSILRKPGPLDEHEWEHMRTHPELGYRMLKDIEFFREALPIVRYHHERYDGSGYPCGLEGEHIPLEARIFAVVDAFDAIMSERPYKRARSFEQAIATLMEDSGKHFDPQVVRAFLRVPREEWLQIIRRANHEDELSKQLVTGKL
jgi:HD-GYP domain-containing protein (c-di-GMP phosphodiesterase class II)